VTVTVEPEASVMTPLKAEDVLENDESLEVPMVITEPLLSVVVLKVSVEDSVEPPLVVQVQVEFHSITVLPSMVVHQAVVGEEPLKVGSREEMVIVSVPVTPLESVVVTVVVLSVTISVSV